MRRLKFKPNLGASRGSGGGSGACVGGGRVRGVVGRAQQGGRQSGDESTGGESTSEVETGEQQKAKWLPVSRPFEGPQSWEMCTISVILCRHQKYLVAYLVLFPNHVHIV